MNAYAPYPNDSAHKLLCDNRERYIRQSALTRDGVVARIPSTRSLSGNSPLRAGQAAEPSDYRPEMADASGW